MDPRTSIFASVYCSVTQFLENFIRGKNPKFIQKNWGIYSQLVSNLQPEKYL